MKDQRSKIIRLYCISEQMYARKELNSLSIFQDSTTELYPATRLFVTANLFECYLMDQKEGTVLRG